MNPPDPRPRTIFDCEQSTYRVPNSLMDESTTAAQTLMQRLRSGEHGMRASISLIRGERRPKRRIYDFIWLVYSVFFLIVPMQQNREKTWIEFGVAFALFLAIYAGLVYSRSKRNQYLLLIALLALAIGYFPINVGACGMFIYVSALVPFVTDSIPFCAATFVASAGILTTEGILLHVSPWSWAICAFFALSVGAGNLVAAQRMRANMKLELAHEQIAQLSRLAERERIARDLHDVLGHTLSVVVLKSELAGKIFDRDPGRARREIGEVEQIARKALTEVREAIRGYRAEGLAAEIDRAQKTLDAAGVTLECGSRPPQLAPAEETVLSLIVREAVTNIVRHAQASRCKLEVQASGQGTALLVEDDGRGGIHEEGNGLRGMRERAESLGGRLHIDSERGTRLRVEIPAQAALES